MPSFCFLHIQPRLDLLRTHFKFPGSAGWCRLWNSILLFHILPLILLFTFCSYYTLFWCLVLFFFLRRTWAIDENTHEFSHFFLFHTLCFHTFVHGSGETNLFLMLQDSLIFFVFLFLSLFFFNERSSPQIFENHLNLGTTWYVSWIYFFRPVARVFSPSLPNNVDFGSGNAINCVWSNFIECNCP